MRGLIFHDLEKGASLAVGLSGGADSMALAHMLCHAPQEPRVFAFTVDHGLREGSGDEAAQVARRVESWPNMTHRILRWEGRKPATRIMEAARAARYRLLAGACARAGVERLALAHHADDQAETFFMRLAHGSGLDGLSAMKRETPFERGLVLWRPLLDRTHGELAAYCRDQGIEWVEDPSNRNPLYARARMRAALREEGFSPKRLASTLRRLESASVALGVVAGRLSARALRARGEGVLEFDFECLKSEPVELVVRVLRAALAETAPRPYGVRLEKLERLCVAILAARKKTAFTLGGCLLTAHPRAGVLRVAREAA